jgi:hypothetical protein
MDTTPITLRDRAQTLALYVRQGGGVIIDQLQELEQQIADAANAVGRGPVGLALNLAKSNVSAAIARLEVYYILQADADREIASHLVLASGHIARAMKAGAAVGSG